ncbi:hypothetical protein [Deinococcus sp. S9]|uniref:hypothetical protein n=1 Tax=Deinococcus sp. S9 TaxID=2545754 RepID=UPI0010561D64|nr:hypothetical protein [Deinococcus sp. S9]TDE85172.1 hypothetical protein E0686_13215 [Deinococcus sp. S9]
MDKSKSGSTPGQASYMGAGGDTLDANTNLDPSLQSGTTPADQQATQEIEQQHTQTEVLPTALTQQRDPARQMDNSGMLKPTGQGPDADLIGASGEDRQDDR